MPCAGHPTCAQPRHGHFVAALAKKPSHRIHQLVEQRAECAEPGGPLNQAVAMGQQGRARRRGTQSDPVKGEQVGRGAPRRAVPEDMDHRRGHQQRDEHLAVPRATRHPGQAPVQAHIGHRVRKQAPGAAAGQGGQQVIGPPRHLGLGLDRPRAVPPPRRHEPAELAGVGVRTGRVPGRGVAAVPSGPPPQPPTAVAEAGQTVAIAVVLGRGSEAQRNGKPM